MLVVWSPVRLSQSQFLFEPQFELHSMERESMLFLTNCLPYLWGMLYSLSNSFFDFCSYGVVSPCDTINNIHTGGWHETLNLRHVSGCKISPKASQVEQRKAQHEDRRSCPAERWKPTSKCLANGLEVSYITVVGKKEKAHVRKKHTKHKIYSKDKWPFHVPRSLSTWE